MHPTQTPLSENAIEAELADRARTAYRLRYSLRMGDRIVYKEYDVRPRAVNGKGPVLLMQTEDGYVAFDYETGDVYETAWTDVDG